MFRLLILLHRYLGIGICLMLLLWCLSGFVMLYVQYPDLDAREQRQLLTAISLKDCCRLPKVDYMEGESLDYFAIEMVADIPVLRLGWYPDDEIAIDMRKGTWLDPITVELARQIATDFNHRRQLDGKLEYRDVVYSDQWTVYGKYQPHRPLHYYAANDAAGTEWYISSTSGEIVQITTAHERLWNWLGSVTHWLYFTKLREHTTLWSWLVIGLAALGVFLTVIGIYLGIHQFRIKATTGGRSPYRSWQLWHHYIGLMFGLFTLTWVFSGLVSMNPWGFLESGGYAGETRLLGGQQLPWAEVQEYVRTLPARELPPDLTRIEVSTLLGKQNQVAHFTTGESQRFNIETLKPEAIGPWDWLKITKILGQETGSAEGQMIQGDDNYYFNHHEQRIFPVWRVLLDDAAGTRYYLNTLNGQILEKFDGNRQWYRWLFLGLHRGDFSRLLRTRPIWDVWILILLAGVTAGTATGAYLGFKRLLKPR